MSDEPTDVKDLISKWDALSEFARDAGLTYGAAKQIRRRSSIPVDYWPAIISSNKGKEIGLSAEDLMRLHADKPASAPSPSIHEAAE